MDLVKINEEIILICNSSNLNFFKKKSQLTKIFTNLIEINKKNLKEFNLYKGIIILCELNKNETGNDVKLTELYGIELAKNFRMQNVNIPIVLTSFISRKQISRLKHGSDIINAIGHKFVRLPASLDTLINTLKKMNKLSPIEMRDVLLFSCHPDGIVNDKIHQIQGIVNKFQSGESSEKIKELLLVCLTEIHQSFGASAANSKAEFNLRFSDINESNINKALTFVKNKGDLLIEQYSQKLENITSLESERKPWKLLILDDEITDESTLIKTLQKKVDVICSSNSKDALNVLNKDNELRGKIPVILTDYRLYNEEDEVQVQQEMQGYSFLQEVGNTFKSRLISAVVYSGMPRQFLLETFRTFKIRSEIYSKIDFKLNDEGALNFLANRILEIGDANYNALLFLPLGNKGWENHLNPMYIKYRNLPDYETRERETCDFCKDWIEQFRAGIIPATPMIKGDSFSPKKSEKEEDTMDRFIAYYKTRRIAQYLYLYFKKKSPETISDEVLDFLLPKNKKVTNATKKGFFSQILGLSLTEFPFGATIEELNWFDYDLGIKVLDNYKLFRKKFDTMEKLIGRFISGSKTLSNIIEGNNFQYEIVIVSESKEQKTIVEGRKGITDKKKKSRMEKRILMFDKNFNPYFFDRRDLGDCMKLLDKYKNIYEKDEYINYLKLIEDNFELWKWN